MIFVEYSKSQNAFHKITKEERRLNENWAKSDYKVIDAFDNHDDADLFIQSNYENIKEFGYYKNKAGEIFLL